MKRSRLPLTALRSFEAAGRHESFSKAADELAVSQAAISRQIRLLEAQLGQPLFAQGHRQVRLNDQGARLLAQLTSSFDAMEALLAEMASEKPMERIAVSVEPTFASLWLLPRLAAFTAKHPTIDAAIEVTASLTRLRAPGPTLGIRHSASQSSWAGLEARHRCDVELTPMMAPSLLARCNVTQPSDLRGAALLCDESRASWTAWLAAAGVRGGVPVRGPTFSNAAIATESAELGQGVVLGDRRLARHMLAGGGLCAPFALTISDGAYWLLAADFNATSTAENAFCEWVRDEMTSGAEVG